MHMHGAWLSLWHDVYRITSITLASSPLSCFSKSRDDWLIRLTKNNSYILFDEQSHSIYRHIQFKNSYSFEKRKKITYQDKLSGYAIRIGYLPQINRSREEYI